MGALDSNFAIGGFTSADYSKYTFKKNLCKNIAVFFHRAEYFFAHGKTLTTKSLIREHVIAHLDAATLELYKPGSLPNKGQDQAVETDKIFNTLISRISNQKLKHTLNGEYNVSKTRYEKALASKQPALVPGDQKSATTQPQPQKKSLIDDAIATAESLKGDAKEYADAVFILVNSCNGGKLSQTQAIGIYELIQGPLPKKDAENFKDQFFRELTASHLNAIYEKNKDELQLIKKIVNERVAKQGAQAPAAPVAKPKVQIDLQLIADLKQKDIDGIITYVKSQKNEDYYSALRHMLFVVDRAQLTAEKVLEIYELIRNPNLSRQEFNSIKNDFFFSNSADQMQKVWEKYKDEAVNAPKHMRRLAKRKLQEYACSLVTDDQGNWNLEKAIKSEKDLAGYAAQTAEEEHYKQKLLAKLQRTLEVDKQAELARAGKGAETGYTTVQATTTDTFDLSCILDYDLETQLGIIQNLRHSKADYNQPLALLISTLDIPKVPKEQLLELYELVISAKSVDLEQEFALKISPEQHDIVFPPEIFFGIDS